MNQRIVFEFLRRPADAPDEWERVARIVTGVGGELLDDPDAVTGRAPYLFRATLPTPEDAEQVVEALRTDPSVGRVDFDTFSFSF